jgi:protein phosphatase
MKVVAGAATDVGRARERNEDSYLAMPPVYIVADGMGGHRGGNVASSLAMEVMSGLSDGGTGEVLAEQVREANSAILERSRNDRSLQGMGTTITATSVENGVVHLAQVGDSRAYLLRGGELQQLTTDHTLVHEMVQRRQITAEEAEHHPQRSILTRALGVDDGVEVDTFEIPMQVGDRLLLCSDGLHSMIDDEAIKQILTSESDPQGAADRLVAQANNAGGLDNITVVIMDFADGEGFEGATWTPPAPADTGTTKESAIPAGLTGERGEDVTAAYEVPAGLAAAGTGGVEAEAGAPPMPGQAPAADATQAQAPAQPATPAYTDAPPTQPAPPEPGRHRERTRGRRIAVWVIAIVAILGIAAVGTRLYLDSQYFVGVENGRVAVFRGVPTKTLGVKMFGVVIVTDIPAAAALACQPWEQPLREGDTASSQDDAEQIVAQIRADLAAGGRCNAGAPGGGGGGGSSGGSPSSSPT